MVRLPLILVALGLAACSSKKPAPPAPEAKAADAAPPPAKLTIRVVNQRAAAILVASPTECAQWPVTITGPEEHAVDVDGQMLDCDSARAGNCPTVGGCPGPQPYPLEPGASITHEWDRREMVQHNLRAAEVGPDCPTSCVTYDAVAGGEYTFQAAAWSNCATPGACPAPPDLTASAKVTLPGANEVVVEFR